MKPDWFLLSDDGKKSLSYSMVVYSFSIVSLWLLAFVIGNAFGIPVPAFDAAGAMGYLSPILATYSFRKHDKSRKKEDPDGK